MVFTIEWQFMGRRSTTKMDLVEAHEFAKYLSGFGIQAHIVPITISR